MRKLRLGFLGTGWIGRHRMEAILATGLCDDVIVCDPAADMADAALALAPGGRMVGSLEEMLALSPDGVVIATPSAAHAAQSVQALEAGCAVFCQKPLGRDGAEARAVVDAARRADRLLSVDFSYRFTDAMRRIRPLVADGALGHVHAIDLTFHNAYGPDKPWFYDRALSGGGCVMDLGVHLIDLALWATDFPEIVQVEAHLSAGGQPMSGDGAVEDHAMATFRTADGRVIRLACSWRLHAGRDAVIEAAFHGGAGGAFLRNLDGSFFDFVAEEYRGTACTTLTMPPDDWGGRAAADWAHRVAAGERHDAAGSAQLVAVAETVERIYAAAGA